MKKLKNQDFSKILETIAKDRTRTNLLRKYEQNLIAYLVQRIPSWVSSDMLTITGYFGSIVVFLSFILAAYIKETYLLLSVLGFAINWFGDSLDGRLAYYRKKPRKWYGFSFDLTIDWLTTILIGWGFIIYAEGIWETLGFGFVVMYGWAMLTALIRYKVTGKYSIDSGIFGPTEVRIIISLILLAEVQFHDSIIYSAAVVCVILFFVNILETRKLLHLANDRDREENEKKLNGDNA